VQNTENQQSPRTYLGEGTYVMNYRTKIQNKGESFIAGERFDVQNDYSYNESGCKYIFEGGDHLFGIIIFGWPGVISSIIISAVGLIKKKPIFLLVGALLAAPASWYLGVTLFLRYWGGMPSEYWEEIAPLLRYWGVVILFVFQVGSAVAIKRKLFWLSWLLALPYISLVVCISFFVLTQQWLWTTLRNFGYWIH